MDASSVVQIISNLGFPIACVCALFWKLNKDQEQHREESAAFSSAIQANTQMLAELKTLLENRLHE